MERLSLYVYTKLAALQVAPQLPSDLQGTPHSIGDIANTVTKLLLFIVGIVGVIMIIIGGLQYILSSGDPNRTRTAKDTILFAVVGIVIALLAYAIVSFVVGRF